MSRQEVIRQIVERHGRQLDLNEETVARDDPPLLTLACDTFGTWETALHYAGFSARIVARQRMYTAETITRTIQRMCSDSENVTATHVRVRQWRFYRAALQQFGSWNQALRAAGVDPRHVRPYPPDGRPNRQQVIEGIAKRHAEGLSMRWMDVSRDNRAFAVHAKHMFGSWGKAVRAAGYSRNGSRLLSDELSPTAPSDATGGRQFVVAPEDGTDSQQPSRARAGKWSKSLIIAELQALHASGIPMISTTLPRPLVRAATRYFAGWRLALAAAGIATPRTGRPPADTKT